MPRLLRLRTYFVVLACVNAVTLIAVDAGASGVLSLALVANMALLVGIYFRISNSLQDLKRQASQVNNFKKAGSGYSSLLEVSQVSSALEATHGNIEQTFAKLDDQFKQQDIIFSGMLEGVIVVDLQGRALMVNESAAAYLGVVIRETIGKDFLRVIEDDGLKTCFQESLRKKQVYEKEVKVTASNIWLQVRTAPLTDGEGRELGVLIVLNDVTRIKNLEETRKDFVANVSHELRTPITSVKGFVETLIDGAIEDKDNAERFLRIIYSQCDRLTSIITDLLTLSRLENERSEQLLMLQDEIVAEILHSVASIAKVRADQKNISIVVDSEREARVLIDRSLLEQALINLVDNAITYSESGTVVKLTALEEGDRVIIKVRDQGPGIPAEHLPRLFERFYRVDKARSRKAGGTGLGLAIVKHIVGVHKGRVYVESDVGEGSSFCVSLKAVAAAEEIKAA